MKFSVVKESSRAGFVYIGESVRQDGSIKLYVGMTSRPVYERVAEHQKNIDKEKRKTWCGQGKSFKLLGYIFTEDRFKFEREIKNCSVKKKRDLAFKWTMERIKGSK